MRQKSTILILLLISICAIYAGDGAYFDWNILSSVNSGVRSCIVEDEWGDKIGDVTYNSDGNLLIVSQFSWDLEDFAITLEWEYDNNGNIIKKIDNWGGGYWNIEEFQYNSRGKLIEMKSYGFDGSNYELYDTTTYEYDNNGNISIELSEDAYMNTGYAYFTYDNTGNVITAEYSGYDGPENIYTYEYDSEGNVTLESHYDAMYDYTFVNTYEYVYDRSSNIIEVTISQDEGIEVYASSFIISYTY